MTSPLRVLYVSATAATGGAEESLLGLLAKLDRARVRPMLALPPPAGNGGRTLWERARELDVECRSAPLRRFKRTLNPLRLAALLAELRRGRACLAELARATGAELIHANSLAAALQCDGAPLVAHLRDLSLPRPAAWLLRARLRCAVAAGPAVAEAARKLFARVELIPNGVDTERFRPGAGEDDAARGYVLMAAHLVPWKRHEVFIRALGEVARRLPEAHGVLAGGDLFGEHAGYAARLRELATQCGLGDRLRFAGAITEEEMPGLFARAAVAVHPACDEPFGRAVAEAMACGRPVVAARGGGPAELLRGGGGRLCAPDNVAEFAAGIAHYLENPELADADGSAGRASIISEYTAELHAERLTELYRKLV